MAIFHFRYSKRAKAQDKLVLTQGIRFVQPPKTAPENLQSPIEKPAQLPTGKTSAHLFHCPPDTAGTAKLKQRQHLKTTETVKSTPSVDTSESAPFISQPRVLAPTPKSGQVIPSQSQLLTFIIGEEVFQIPQGSDIHPPSSVPYTTQRYRKRKSDQEKAGVFKRKYEKKTNIKRCKQCGEIRQPPAHEQYFGNWYCSNTATCTYAEWKEQQKEKGYGKKKLS